MSVALTNLCVWSIVSCFLVAWFSCVPRRLYDQVMAEFINALYFYEDTCAIVTDNPGVQATMVIALISLILPVFWLPLAGYARFVFDLLTLCISVCVGVVAFLAMNVLRYF